MGGPWNRSLSQTPDSPLAEKFTPSPNHGERLGPLDALILHYTGMPTGEAALKLLTSETGGVSCHYLVWEDGRIWQLVAENRRAWHAGKSFWQGETDLNSRSIGIEIIHPGHRGGLPPRPEKDDGGSPSYPDAQIEAVIALAQDICARHKISRNRVLAHSDIAPSRKIDPGEFFPWRRLHEAGVGLWVEPAPIRPGPVYEPGALGPPVAALQQMLAAYGYGVEITGAYDAQTRDTVAAFQRHFRPERVDGIADLSTLKTIHALIKAASPPS
jgi:N-acetylmuramoyl-L-alanine amidase